jgi:hypothetical protein
MICKRTATTLGCLAVALGTAVAANGAHGSAFSSNALQVVVPPGQAVQFAFTADSTESFFSPYSASFQNAITMAMRFHPTIRGFRIQENPVETSCPGDDSGSANAIVANLQNAAVLGNLCSIVGAETALPIYEAHGVVAISGSATADSLPALAPTVFDRTAVSDGDGGTAWLAAVQALPTYALWRTIYELEFGSPPTDYAELYFDAANLLFARLQQVARVVNGSLVIDRAALARAVRDTTNFPGVSCSISFDPATGNRLNDAASLARCAGQLTLGR